MSDESHTRNTNHMVTSRNRVHNDVCDIILGGGVDTASGKIFLDIADVFAVGLRWESLPLDSHSPLDTWRICFKSSRGLIAFWIISVP